MLMNLILKRLRVDELWTSRRYTHFYTKGSRNLKYYKNAWLSLSLSWRHSLTQSVSLSLSHTHTHTLSRFKVTVTRISTQYIARAECENTISETTLWISTTVKASCIRIQLDTFISTGPCHNAQRHDARLYSRRLINLTSYQPLSFGRLVDSSSRHMLQQPNVLTKNSSTFWPSSPTRFPNIYKMKRIKPETIPSSQTFRKYLPASKSAYLT
jgi:hypothetical protein